jgi:hypothetical protein
MTEPKRRGRPPKIKPAEAAPNSPITEAEFVAEAEKIWAACKAEADPVIIPNDPPSVIKVEDVEAEIASAFEDKATAEEFRPVPALTEVQKEAWLADLVSAYQSQDETKRSDPFGRLWTLRYEIVKGHTHMMVHAKRGIVEASRLILTSQFTKERAIEAIEAVDREAV